MAIEGRSHAFTHKVEIEIVSLQRRGKDLERAETRARRILSNDVCLFGAQSLPARYAARALEHVLMDKEDWHQALEVCFSVVGSAVFCC